MMSLVLLVLIQTFFLQHSPGVNAEYPQKNEQDDLREKVTEVG